MRKLTIGSLVAVVALVLAACSSGGGSLDVSLYEWGVDSSSSSVDAGDVTFNVTNDGGEPHELVIVKGVAPADLPLDEDGKVIEDDLPEGAFIGEIEEFEAGTTESGTFNLEAGTYTIFCNLLEVEDGEPESHFLEGMVTTITVNS